MVIMAGRRWLRAAFVNNLLNQQRLSRQQKALVPTLTGIKDDECNCNYILCHKIQALIKLFFTSVIAL